MERKLGANFPQQPPIDSPLPSFKGSVATLYNGDCEHENQQQLIIGVYKRRYWMMFLYFAINMLNGEVFTHYVSIANITMCYYDVSAEATNWTATVVMVVYLFLATPMTWVIAKVGLRPAVIIGAVCNTISCALQFATLSPERFPIVMLSCFMAALGTVCLYAVPPCLAATWFPSKEVSRACAMGIFGYQVGVAIGFVMPPLLISNDCTNKDLISEEKMTVAIILTALNSVVLLLIITTFRNKPEFPPSLNQAVKEDAEDKSYIQSAISLFKNINFILLFVVYGLSMGVYYAFSVVLNNLVLDYFENAEVAIGLMGLLFIVAGLVGAIIAGVVLDYTHRFKETSVLVCVASFICYVVFCFLLRINLLWVQYITISALGFFLTGFLPVGLEYGVEITYPEKEIMSAGILMSSTVLFGIILTEVSSYVLQHLGPNYAHGIFGGILLLSSIACCFITKKYRRSQTNKEVSSE